MSDEIKHRELRWDDDPRIVIPLFIAGMALLGAIGFNAFFCEAGTVNEMEGAGWRFLIGGILGGIFGLCVASDLP